MGNLASWLLAWRINVPEISRSAPRDRDRRSLDLTRMWRQGRQQLRRQEQQRTDRCDANEAVQRPARAMMNWLAAAVDDTEGDWPAASALEQLCTGPTGYPLLQ